MRLATTLSRRGASQFLGAAMAALAAGRPLTPANAAVKLGGARPFSAEVVDAMARDLARRPFEPLSQVPEAWRQLDYSAYRAINFDADRAVWRGEGRSFELQMFSPGFYFKTGVMIDIVENGQSRMVMFDPALFQYGDAAPDLPVDPEMGFSGFRIHGHINRPDYRDEFVVFQGASYFRGVGRGQGYGLSARGLALRTADPAGEEFPIFRKFWVETPAPDSDTITVHALLDSESVAGAYHFTIRPGDETIMDCSCVLYPRTALDHVGIAALTSMYLFNARRKKIFDDFRNAVHDSDGLAILNGNGERLWRPLSNPATLQVSNFLDRDPNGFGLMQRNRNFSDYNDLEARYERRPSLWIEPADAWGRGSVSLVEIPTDEEIYDNIVAYWRPTEVMEAGSEYRYAYRAVWGGGPAPDAAIARVGSTSFGKDLVAGRLAIIDFDAPLSGRISAESLTADVHVIRGEKLGVVVQDNPETGGTRLALRFEPGQSGNVELRAQLRHEGRPVSEVWLYRWTPSR